MLDVEWPKAREPGRGRDILDEDTRYIYVSEKTSTSGKKLRSFQLMP